MRKTYECKTFCVFDDVLPPDAFASIWKLFQRIPLRPVNNLNYAWRIYDGEPLGSVQNFLLVPRTLASRKVARELAGREMGLYPTQSPLDHVLRAVERIATRCAAWVGERGPDWHGVSLTAFIYPRGTSLSWHLDSHHAYSGAYIFYVSPEWGANWGGELLVADEHLETSNLPSRRTNREHRAREVAWSPRFETKAYGQWLLYSGVGHYVMPRPNRLVLLGDAPHCILPVRETAGEHVRASTAGFFLRRLPGETQVLEEPPKRAPAKRARRT